jgi:hypothetical protein
MQTFLYDLNINERVGPIREGYFTVDGVRPTLPSHVVEIEVVYPEKPNFNPQTQTIDYLEYLNLSELKFKKGYVVRDLTQQEIDAMNQPQIEPVPETCTPRQFRLSLLEFNIDPDFITSFIEQLSDPIESKKIMIIWEYANSFERNDPLINQFGELLNIDSETIDNIFRKAITYL